MAPLAEIGLGLNVLGTVAGGIFGGRDSRKARREQQALINRGLGRFADARGAVDDAEARALDDLDFANEVLADLPGEVLSGLDEQLRIRIGQQVRQDIEERENTQARLATAGLDASTVGVGIQQRQRYGQANRIGALSAGFAGTRANALMGARGMQVEGLRARAGAVGDFGRQRAGLYEREGNALLGINVQPPNTGAGIGAALGGIAGALTNYSTMTQADRHHSAIMDFLTK